jgi:SAM-dependent methyltransferase
MVPTMPAHDLDEEQLLARAAARVGSGEYPPSLDADLTRHYEEILGGRGSRAAGPLDALLARVDDASDFRPERIPYSSRVPLGSGLHRTVGKIVRRQTAGILGQMDRYARTVRELLAALTDQVADEAVVRESGAQLNARLDSVLEMLARRAPAAREDDAAGWLPEPALTEFLEGPREGRLELLAPLADVLAGAAPVLVLTCGRGEMLELLKARGAEASGVERAPELVAACRAQGLSADVADPLDRLAGAADGVGAVFADGLLRRLPARRRADLVLLAGRRLRPGGLLVLRDLDPGSLRALSVEIPADPLAVGAAPPAYAAFLCEQAGFAEVRLEHAEPAYTLIATR